MIRLEDLVECRLCFALTMRETRARHLEWHAKWMAKVLAPHDCAIYHQEPRSSAISRDAEESWREARRQEALRDYELVERRKAADRRRSGERDS